MATQAEIQAARMREQFLSAAYAARQHYLDGFKMRADANNYIDFFPACY